MGMKYIAVPVIAQKDLEKLTVREVGTLVHWLAQNMECCAQFGFWQQSVTFGMLRANLVTLSNKSVDSSSAEC